MQRLLVFALIGFVAQLIDGALGMAYGITSSSLLLLFGVAPAIASASIHMAEIVTTAASAAAHLRFKNVDKAMVVRLIVPGSVSAFIGAAFLSSLPGDRIKPFVSLFLIFLGVYILFRFLFRIDRQPEDARSKPSSLLLTPLGIVGGFFDAVGGGGWGPIATPVLLARKGSSPRMVVGTVDTSEFAIAVSATLGFALFLGWEQFHWEWVAAFMIGGVLAAPLAAWLVRIIPAHLLGVLVGGVIILTNASTLMNSADVLPSRLHPVVYALLLILWAAAILYQIARHKRHNNRPNNKPPAPETTERTV